MSCFSQRQKFEEIWSGETLRGKWWAFLNNNSGLTKAGMESNGESPKGQAQSFGGAVLGNSPTLLLGKEWVAFFPTQPPTTPSLFLCPLPRPQYVATTTPSQILVFPLSPSLPLLSLWDDSGRSMKHLSATHPTGSLPCLQDGPWTCLV